MPQRRLLIPIFVLVMCFASSVNAQENLIANPGFEGDYVGRGRFDFSTPAEWNGWYTNSPSTEEWMNTDPIAFPHTGSIKRGGDRSQNIGRGDGTFTAAIYQQIQGIPAGTILRATVWGFIENTGGKGAQIRVGIGNGVGGNPFGAGIVWSGWHSTVDSWIQPTVDATATGGEVTIFLYATQQWPSDPNNVYWDDASLTAVGTGEVPDQTDGGSSDGGDDSEGGEPVVVAPPVNVAPFVAAQGSGDDGSVVHTIQPGDTLAAIAVAYGVPVAEILSLNNIDNPGMITIGQQIIIRPPDESTGDDETGVEGETVDPESTEEADVEPDVTEEPAAEDVATEEPDEDVPSPTPSPTVPVSTPTEAPPAPVVSVASGNVHPVADPAALASVVCALMFEDTNLNRIHEDGEGLLPGGMMTLSIDGADVGNAETDGVSEPLCFEELAAGDYIIAAGAPGGYGLTTPRQYRLSVSPGTRVNVAFGAATGVEESVAPPADSADTTGTNEATDVQEEPLSTAEQLFEISGLLAFGLAAIVLIGGLGISFALRRR